ncbi:unnamed protein product [Diamesa serratosioi]
MTKMTATEKILEKFNFLPPKVCGRTRGYFDLVFEDIRWNTSKSFIGIEAKIQFWGQTKATSEKFTTNFSKHKSTGNSLGTVRYHIRTNFTLFQAYLNNSEPLEIEVFSSKTQTLIGSSKIDLSKVLSKNQVFQENASLRLASQILNKRQFNLGELIVVIKIQYFVPIKMTKSIQIQKSSEIMPVKKALIEKENKENIEVVGKAKRISFKEPAQSKPSTLCKTTVKSYAERQEVKSIATKQFPSNEFKLPISPVNLHQGKKDSIMSYLSGDPLSLADESSILKDIVSISPAHSFIEALDKIKPLPRKENLLNRIDSIKISLSGIDFTSAGILELQESSKYHKKSLIKCVVTSKLFTCKEDVKMISPVFEIFPRRISFNKNVIQKVKIPQQKQDFKNNYINFGFCHRSIEQETPPFFIGFVRVNIADVMNSKFSFHKKCRIISENEMIVGSIDVKLELGVGGLHFGKHLLDSFECFRDNISVYSDESIIELNHDFISNQNFQPICRPSHDENNCETNGQRYESKNTQTEKKINKVNLVTEHSNSNEDAEMVDVEKAGKQSKSKIYHGLLCIDDLRNVKKETSVEYFINYEGFWNECLESTEQSVDLSFNYLKQFPVICDDSFLKRVQNNHMELKLWEKNGNNTEKWIGSAKIPLHQFFIAFRDIAMIEHLSTNKLPIISIDSWTNFISPLSMEQFCQCKILLAIGNEHQIDYLKMSRKIPKLVSLPSTSASCANAEATNEIKNKLTAFIESLTHKLPEKLVPAVEPVEKITKPPSESQQELRKTSDLLESLQNALSKVPPPPSEPPATTTKIIDMVDSDTSISSISSEKFKVLIEVEQAIHLPKVIKKKTNRRNKTKSLNSPTIKTEIDPSAYATFEGCLGNQENCNQMVPPNVIKSHEGYVYTTNVEKSSNPQWNKSFEVQLPVDILLNPQKRFVVKVWRKTAIERIEMTPKPLEDSVIGFAAIDLSVLLTGLPLLSGWYNIIDFSGRCNGQIKMSFKPLENVLKYQPELIPSLNCHLDLDVDIEADGSTLLSRTLKRKFNELDEITQRLKARLFDVTGDEDYDPDDEFEKDLNTEVDDMDDEHFKDEDFAWLGKGTSENNLFNEQANAFQSHLSSILNDEPQPSTSKGMQSHNRNGSALNMHQRNVSGCSNPQPQQFSLDQLLKNYDLDTIINPNIFKNLLDPTLANSDSTPTLNPAPLSDNLINISIDSDTTVSSNLSSTHDHVQTIQNALQRASIDEFGNDQDSRPGPEGKNKSPIE